MKKTKIKIILTTLVFFLTISNTNAGYFSDSVKNFINSPSVLELNSIEDEKMQYCEQIFLEAYMRREFSENENIVCGDVFSKKIEDNLNYMKYVYSKRGIY